jgi:hypothetical protein
MIGTAPRCLPELRGFPQVAMIGSSLSFHKPIQMAETLMTTDFPNDQRGDFKRQARFHAILDFKKVQCKHQIDSFPLLRFGKQSMDKTAFETLIAVFNAPYECVGALAFASGENGKVDELSENCRELRAKYVKERPMSKIVTHMPKSLWRLTIRKGPRHKTRLSIHPKSRGFDFTANNSWIREIEMYSV